MLIIVALALLVLLGQYLWFYVFAKAEGLVFAPARTPVLAVVDGGEAVRVPAGEVGRFELTLGAHRVRLQLGGASLAHALTIKAAHERIVLPVAAPQCFATLDVTTSHYQRSSQAGQPPSLPLLTDRHTEAEPFALPANVFFSQQDLPERANAQAGVYLFRPVACQLLGLPNEDLVKTIEAQGVLQTPLSR